MIAALRERLSHGYATANRLLWNIPARLWLAFGNFNRARAGEAAASIAYYALFSLFPLLLLFIAGGSYILERDQVTALVIRYASAAIPISTDVLAENINRALNARGPIGVTGFIGLTWSAIGVFSAVAINVNLAWDNARSRSFFQKRLIGLLMVFVLAALLLASLVINGLINLFIAFSGTGELNLSIGIAPYRIDFWELVSSLASWALLFLMFLALYRFVPTARASWRAALWGALAATLLSLAATRLFGWYLRVGPANYEVVYGSLGTVVATMFLIYILAWITLYSAHVAACFAPQPPRPAPAAETPESK